MRTLQRAKATISSPCTRTTASARRTKERACAKKIAGLLSAQDFTEIDLKYFEKFGASSLTDKKIEVDRFNPARAHIPNSYVPFRNANLLAIATSYAEAKGADAIFIGVQALDYSGYPTAGRHSSTRSGA